MSASYILNRSQVDALGKKHEVAVEISRSSMDDLVEVVVRLMPLRYYCARITGLQLARAPHPGHIGLLYEPAIIEGKLALEFDTVERFAEERSPCSYEEAAKFEAIAVRLMEKVKESGYL
jgi:hypothetical protein